MDELIRSEGKKVSNKRRTLIFLNLNISCIAESMLSTALLTSLPPIIEDLNITVDTGQWLTSGFSLFLAVMTPFTGYLVSRFKTKRLYCIAIGFFIVGLTVCAFSKNFYTMMFGRIIQGCGNGLLASMGQVVILTIFPPERIGTVMGWYGLSTSVAPIVSPTIAGILVDTVGWRMIFVIAITIMSLSLIFALFVFEDVLPTMNRKFDMISLIISVFAFGGITFAAGNIGTYDFVSNQVLLSLIVGIITGIIFSWRQLHIDVPFLDITVLKNKIFTVSLTATVILHLIFMGSLVILPVYVQQVKGNSATISGLVVLPGSMAMAIINPFAGRIYDIFGMKLLITVAPIVLMIGNAVIYFIDIHQSIWIISVINIFRCLALNSLFMPLVTWAMKDIPKYKTSDATALYHSIRHIGGASGSALFISVMTKVANTIGKNKESPKMYGINIVFLLMGFFSLLIVILGMVGCKEKLIQKKSFNKNIVTNNMTTQEIPTTKDITDIEIIINKNKIPCDINKNNNSNTDTIVNEDNVSINDDLIKNESSEIVIGNNHSKINSSPYPISLDKIEENNNDK